MRWASLLLAGFACAVLSGRAAAVTLTFELDLLEGDYAFVPEEKNQTIVFPAAQAFRAISFTLALEGQSTCSAACDPPSSFLFRLGTGTFLNIGPFEGPLDLSLPITPFRPLFFVAGEPLPLALSLGRYPEPPGMLVPVPSAPASVTRAEIRFTGDLIAVPEPRAAALLLPGLAATLFAAGSVHRTGSRGPRVSRSGDSPADTSAWNRTEGGAKPEASVHAAVRVDRAVAGLRYPPGGGFPDPSAVRCVAVPGLSGARRALGRG